MKMNFEDHDEFLCRIAKTLYYGKTSSFDSVSLPLTELAAELYNEVKKDSGLERLQVKEVAEFNQNACVSTCSLVLAILYLEKIKSANPEYIEKVAPSELLLVSLLVASKFLNDDVEEDMVLNSEWAVCAGLTVKQVNQIEKKFLQAINWEIYVPENKFWSRLLEMEKYLANQEGKRRGWYSYTELSILLCFKDFEVVKDMLTCYLMCCISYTASVLSMIGFGLLAIQVRDIIMNNVSFNGLISESGLSTTCCSSASNTTDITNPPFAAFSNASEISDDLLTDEIDSCDLKTLSTENSCDNTTCSRCFSNVTSERFYLSVKLPLTYTEILNLLQRNKKSNVIKKKSLIFTKYV
ncbi:protein CNPPD1 [Planococcus citri]|uniref:protein CNPPD1 n=1 Tax=Planococcus citri TaxID=170843 RepID=UPI0031F749F1